MNDISLKPISLEIPLLEFNSDQTKPYSIESSTSAESSIPADSSAPSCPADPQPEISLHPAVKRVAEITGSLGFGALVGYGLYGLTFLAKRLGKIAEGEVIHPVPYVLAGVVYMAILETARLTYDVALHFLGERKMDANVEHSQEKSVFDPLRQHSWKVIERVENLQYQVDVVFSRILGIATAKEIQDQQIQDRDLYFMEIFRRALKEQVIESAQGLIPQELSICFIEACGYTILGAHTVIWINALGFIFGNQISNPFDPLPPNSGLINRITRVYEKTRIEDEEALKKAQAQEEKQPSGETPPSSGE